MIIKPTGFLLVAIIISIGINGTAQALVINTYTDALAWGAAVTPTGIVDFNNEPTNSGEPFLSRDFGPFTVNSTYALTNGVGVFPSIQEGTSVQNVDGTNHLAVQINFVSAESMNWTFDNPIRAIGFDWRNTDLSGDTLEIEIEGQFFQFGVPVSAGGLGSGFFGFLLSDGVTSEVKISDTTGGGGALALGGFDNIQYSVVPIPAAVWLFASGLIGLIVVARRKG